MYHICYLCRSLSCWFQPFSGSETGTCSRFFVIFLQDLIRYEWNSNNVNIRVGLTVWLSTGPFQNLSLSCQVESIELMWLSWLNYKLLWVTKAGRVQFPPFWTGCFYTRGNISNWLAVGNRLFWSSMELFVVLRPEQSAARFSQGHRLLWEILWS